MRPVKFFIYDHRRHGRCRSATMIIDQRDKVYEWCRRYGHTPVATVTLKNPNLHNCRDSDIDRFLGARRLRRD